MLRLPPLRLLVAPTRWRTIVCGLVCLLLGQTVLAQPDLNGPGVSGEEVGGQGGNAAWRTFDGYDYPDLSFDYDAIDLGGGIGEEGGDGLDGGLGGHGGRLTLQDLIGNLSFDYGFKANSIDLTGGKGGAGESGGILDADGARGGDGGHLYVRDGRFRLGDVNLNGGQGGKGGGSGEGGNGGTGGYLQVKGSLLGMGSGQTSTITLQGGFRGSGSSDIGGIAPGASGDSGIVEVLSGANWISSNETGIFNLVLAAPLAGVSNGFDVEPGDAGSFYMSGGTVQWLAGEIDINSVSGDAGGLFEMTGGEFTLDGASINMEYNPLAGAPRMNLLGGTFKFNNGSINLGQQIAPGSPQAVEEGLLTLDGGTFKTSQQWFDEQFDGSFSFNSGTLHLTDSHAFYGDKWLAAVDDALNLSDSRGRTLIVDGNLTKDSSNDNTFNLNDAGKLIVGGTFHFESGLFNMIGGEATVGRLDIPDHIDFRYTRGYLTLTNGTTDFRTLFSGDFVAPEEGFFTVRSAGTFRANGITGNGIVAIESGGTIDVVYDAKFGFIDGLTNTLTVDGAGSQLITGDDFIIGYSSGATTNATISNGGEIDVYDLTTIGFNGGAFGRLTVDNGRLETHDLRVSDIGAGRLTISNGGVVDVQDEANLGWWYGSDSFVLVEDSGSELNVSGDLYIGRRGFGEISIRADADAVVAARTWVGSSSDSQGGLYLDGAGATFTANTLYVSDIGSGFVQVGNGASLLTDSSLRSLVDKGDAYIGWGTNSNGRVDVQDNGSRFDVDEDLVVGYTGVGVLNVTDGGVVDVDGDLTIGKLSDSTGTVTIDSGGELYARNLLYGEGTSTLNFINGTLGLTADQTLDSALINLLGINSLNSNQTLQLGGTVSLSSAITYNAAGTLRFGNLQMSNGSLDVEGEVISSGQTNIGQSSQIDVQGGSYTSGDTLTLGADSGTASQLNLSSGQLNFSGGLDLAIDSDEAADFSVSGGTATGDTITIGTGDATFTQSGGTINLAVSGSQTEHGGNVTINGGDVDLTGGTLSLAGQTNTHVMPPDGGRFEINGGNVELNGGTINLTGGDSLSGEAGEAGDLWLNGGTLTLSSGNILMAPGAAANSNPRPAYGDLIIDGGTLNVHPDTVAGIVDGELDFRSGTIHMRTEYGVGITTGAIADELGNAHLTLGSGQKITTEGNFSVAANGGATATLSNSAMVTVGADALVGDTPDTEGTLTIQSGSSMVTAGEVIIGRNGGSPGETNVQGAGSRLNVGTQLVVSDGGHGALNIMSGGKVESAGDTNIGWWHDSDGEVTVSGTDSELEVNGALTVGTRGEGTLTIGTGGEVQAYMAAQPVTLADNAAATGTLILDGGNLDIHTLVVGSGSASTDLRSGRIRFTGQQVIDAEIVNLLGLDGLAADGVELQMLNHAQIMGSGADVILAGGTWDLTSHNLEVLAGASIGGSGRIDGAVTIDSNSSINPGNSPGTLTVQHLTLSASSVLNFELATAGVVGSGVNDLIDIEGDLILDGILNVSALDGFGAGSYQLMSIGGSLTQNNGLEFGSMPAGYNFELSTFTSGQVNLVVSAVPEPAAFAMVMSLMALTWAKTRRRRLIAPPV